MAAGRQLTEFAGSATPLRNPSTFQLPGPDLDTGALATHTHPVEFMTAFRAQNFPRGDGAIFALFQKYIPLPASLEGTVSEQQFYNSIEFYRTEIDDDPGRIAFDAAGLANELQTAIVDPLLKAREILGAQPYLTRLFTTMSAEEMTLDPEFDFNASAPDVSNVHTAQGRISCSADGRFEKAQLTLANGKTYSVDWNTGSITEGPFAARVEQYAATGEPALIQDNSNAIDAVIGAFNPAGPPPQVPIGSCGCAAQMAPSAVGALLPCALALLFVARRRRSRTS